VLGQSVGQFLILVASDATAGGDLVELANCGGRVALLQIPELRSSAGGGSDPEPGELFCYAGKAHPELAASGELLVTYVCNVFAETGEADAAVLERLRTTPSLYRPRPVRLAVPPAGELSPQT